MPKDMGMEWNIPQEISKSAIWELDSTDRLSGFTGITLKILDGAQILPESINLENLYTIWSPDKYEVVSVNSNGSFSVETRLKSDSNNIMRYTYDQTKNTLSFSNENLLMEDVNDHYDPTEENIAACQRLSDFSKILGLPPLNHEAQLEIQNHIIVKVKAETEASNKFLARLDQMKIESSERVENARKVYDSILSHMLLEVNPELANLEFDDKTFLDPDVRLEIARRSRINTIGEISSILAKEPDYFSNPKNIAYLKEYLKSALIGHNWFPTDDIESGRIGKHDDFRQVFKISDGPSLSAVIVNTNTRKYQEVGTGWSPDRPTYLLPIIEFGSHSLAFDGDIDDPSGSMEYRKVEEEEKYFESVYSLGDVAIIQAIYDQEWDRIFLETGRHPTDFGYNEVLVFSKIDFTKLTPDRNP